MFIAKFPNSASPSIIGSLKDKSNEIGYCSVYNEKNESSVLVFDHVKCYVSDMTIDKRLSIDDMNASVMWI